MEDRQSDEELKAQLASFGVDAAISDQTRGLYYNKLKKLKGEEPIEKTAENEKTAAAKSISQPTDTTSTPTTPAAAATYYGVAISTATPESSASNLSPFYDNTKDLVKALKGCVGARFKKFDAPEEAEAFAQNVLPQELGPKYSIEKALSPLPNVKTREKNKLRLLIEEGKLEEFSQKIWSNPKFLLATGETPEIVQEGTRRNPLHCAAHCGQLEFCKEIMSIIHSDKFWEMVYPEDSLSVREKNKRHIIDLYLNMQDGNERVKTYETPLHIASKNGFEDVVAYLMSFPETDTTKRNGEGKTAAEIACTRAKSDSCSAELKSRIQDLINNPPIYYVPVIRSKDNSLPPSLGTPCTREECLSGESTQLSESFTATSFVGQAFAGPLSPVKAHELFREWKSPSSKEAKKIARTIRSSDPDRGLERLGRVLAHREGVGWMEYWEFIGSYCDLSKHEGLQKLDNYLSSLSSSLSSSTVPVTTAAKDDGILSSPQSSSLEKDDTAVPSNDIMESPKRRLFADDNCHDDTVSSPQALSTQDTEDPLINVPTTLERDSLVDQFEVLALNEPDVKVVHVYRTPTKNVFIARSSEPTKLDYDVYKALCDITVDPHDYPHVFKWKEIIESFSEEEQRKWHTPRTVRPPRRTLFSPLVYSSPPPSSSPSSRRSLQRTTVLTPQRRLVNTQNTSGPSLHS